MGNFVLQFEDRFNEREILLLQILNKHEVKFILVGGVAVAFHGARTIENTINDIDFLYLHSRTNAQRVSDAVSELHLLSASLVVSFDEGHFARSNAQYHIDWMYCDLLSALSEGEFDRFASKSVAVEVKFQPLKVLSIEHLIEMKSRITGGVGQQTQKHETDVKNLKALL